MSNTENTNETERPGLTKPLVNNIGGVIDQDAPSADQLLEGRSEEKWGDKALRKGDAGVHDEDTGGFIPTGAERIVPDPTERAPGGGGIGHA